jgi:hypothetical protein
MPRAATNISSAPVDPTPCKASIRRSAGRNERGGRARTVRAARFPENLLKGRLHGLTSRRKAGLRQRRQRPFDAIAPTNAAKILVDRKMIASDSSIKSGVFSGSSVL